MAQQFSDTAHGSGVSAPKHKHARKRPVCTPANPVRLPHHRHHVTPAGWAALGCVAFWAALGTAIWLVLR